jgi:putative acetyltransferase
MIEIRPIKPDESELARRLIYAVAKDVFNDPLPLQEIMAHYDSRGTLEDMDDIRENYFENGGIFLVMTDDDKIICTGAVRKLEEGICELKRLWLLSEYHGRGLGYRMMQELLSFARGEGYQCMRLETDPVSQKSAMDFYKRLGFYEIPKYSRHDDEIAMEIIL